MVVGLGGLSRSWYIVGAAGLEILRSVSRSMKFELHITALGRYSALRSLICSLGHRPNTQGSHWDPGHMRTRTPEGEQVLSMNHVFAKTV